MKNINKRAFTMAEMMVVVVILGVIAALVLPGMIQDHQKQINLAKTAKWYNEISKMVAMKNLEEDDGIATKTVNSHGIAYLTTLDEAFEFFKPLRPIKIDTSTEKKRWTYHWLSGEVCDQRTCLYNGGATVLQLPDGATINTSTYAGDIAYKAFAIDPNGKKGPNIVGQDLFIFAITEENGVQPVGSPGAGTGEELFGEYDRDVLTGKKAPSRGGDSSYACSENAAKGGFWCSALLRMDGWTFKEDYPY